MAGVEQGLGRLDAFGVPDFVPQQAGVAQNPCQQIIEVVRDTAGQDAEALQLLRLLHLQFDRFAFGYVRRNQYHTVGLRAVGEDRRCPHVQVDLFSI